MKKLLKYILSFGLSVFLTYGLHAQGIEQKFGAYALTMDSLYTHVGLQGQYVIVYGEHYVNDGFGAIFMADSTSPLAEVPRKVIKVTGTTNKKWIAVQLSASSGDTGVFNNPDYAVINILTVPPGSPADQDKYLSGQTQGSGSAGAWIGEDTYIQTWNAGTSAWIPTVPTQGQLLINGSNDDVLLFDGTNWNVITSTFVFHNGGDNYGAINQSIGNKRNKRFDFRTNNIIRGGFAAAGWFSLYYLRNGSTSDSVAVFENGEIRRVSRADYLSGVGGSGLQHVVAAYGLSNVNDSTLKADSATLSNYYVRHKDSSVAGGYYPYSSNPKSYLVAADIAGKLNISDTASMLSSYSTKINKNIDSITAHNTRIINEAAARDNADIKTLGVTGTTTKTITLTKGDASTITGTFTDQTGGSSGTSVTEQMIIYRRGEIVDSQVVNTSTGAITNVDTTTAGTGFLHCPGNTSITFSVPLGYENITVYGWWYDTTLTPISEIRSNSLIATKVNSYTATSPTNARFLWLYTKKDGLDFNGALQIKSTATFTYTLPITPDQFSWASGKTGPLNEALKFAHYTSGGEVDVTGLYKIDSTIIMPSGTHLHGINGATIVLDSASKTNILRNESVADPSNIFERANVDLTIDNIHFIGPKSAWGSDNATGVGAQLWRAIALLFANVDRLNVSDVTVENTPQWGTELEWTRNAIFNNVKWLEDSTRANQDGINIRTGCENITINNPFFHTHDDAWAITNLLLGDSNQVLGTHKIWAPWRTDYTIRHIRFTGTNSDSSGNFGTVTTPQMFKSGGLILPEDGRKIDDVTVDGKAGVQQILICPIFFHYYVTTPTALGDMTNLHVLNTGNSKIYIGTPIQDADFRNVSDRDIWNNLNCVLPNGSRRITRKFSNGQEFYIDSVGGNNKSWTITNTGLYDSAKIGFGKLPSSNYQVDILGKANVSDSLVVNNSILLNRDVSNTTASKLFFQDFHPAAAGQGSSGGGEEYDYKSWNTISGLSIDGYFKTYAIGVSSNPSYGYWGLDGSYNGSATTNLQTITYDGKVGWNTSGVPSDYLQYQNTLAGVMNLSFSNLSSSGATQLKIGATGARVFTGNSGYALPNQAVFYGANGTDTYFASAYDVNNGSTNQIHIRTGGANNVDAINIAGGNPGHIGLATSSSTSTWVNFAAGSTNVAPLIIGTSNLILTTPLNGVMERDNTDWYITNTAARYKILKGFYGSFSGAASSTTTFTVTIGVTMPSATYSVDVTPTATIGNGPFIVTNKTTTTFDVVYATGITGTETFDWDVKQ